jgi:hypothetical protein
MMTEIRGEATKLEGWKEIAAHFGKGVRTVQMWEKDHGLPIHREMKRVWAWADELDEWRARNQVLAATPEESAVVPSPVPAETHSDTPPPARGKRSLRWALGLTAVAAVAAIGAWVQPGYPVDYQVQGRVLTAIDTRQRVSWRVELPTVPPVEARTGPAVLQQLRGYFSDIDDDGTAEFFYRYWPADLAKQNSALYCFRPDGTMRWSFSPGRSLTLQSGKTIGGTYTVARVAFLKAPRADGGRIVVVSNHSWDWPQQVAILTAEGKLVDEYWHPGWFFSLDVADLDRDGAEEILLGGVSNAYGVTGRGAVLVVLDSRRIGGQGRVPKGSRLQVAGMPNGVERRVLSFPEFEPNPNPNYYGHVERVVASDNGEVHLVISQGFGEEVYAFPYAHVELDSKLSVTRVLPGARLAQLLEARLTPETLARVGRSAFFTKSIADVRELVE